jgi:hypothetical protein
VIESGPPYDPSCSRHLDCLYRLGEVLESAELTIHALLGEVLLLLPPALKVPTDAFARVTFETIDLHSDLFRETSWTIRADLVINGTKRGALEAGYLHEQSFRQEERQLLSFIANRLQKPFGLADLATTLREIM